MTDEAKGAKRKALSDMSDAELTTEEARLAKARTSIRHEQNAVHAEQEMRTMLAGLSGASREVVRARLGGTIGSSGSASARAGGGKE